MRERIIDIMSRVLEQPITEDSSIDNVEGWDSLKHMNLIGAIEKEFNIRIPDEDTIHMINFRLIKYIINEQIQL